MCTRFSKTQFGILMTVREKSDTALVMDRLTRRFYKKIASSRCRLHYDYEILNEKLPLLSIHKNNSLNPALSNGFLTTFPHNKVQERKGGCGDKA